MCTVVWYVFALIFLHLSVRPWGTKFLGVRRPKADLPHSAWHYSQSKRFPESPSIVCVHAHERTHITSRVPEPIHQALIAGPCQPPAPGLQASSQGLEFRASRQSVMALGHGPSISFDVSWITEWLKKGGLWEQELHSTRSGSVSCHKHSECVCTCMHVHSLGFRSFSTEVSIAYAPCYKLNQRLKHFVF